MVKKKIDNRIRVLIENGVKLGHRSLFIIIGDKARDQVPIIYDILTKCTVKARPTVLWCYKNKDEAISNHGKKRMKKIASGKIDINEADLFDTFRISTTIHGRYYSDTYSILGRTYGVCVLQDFEALTPNLLARTIETVEGGGVIIILLKTITSLKQVYTMSMDVHKRFRTEAHQTITCRFNERLILSLADCKRCLVLNEDLVILPLSSKTAEVVPVNIAKLEKTEKDILLEEVKNGLRDTPPAGLLVNLCKTYDQAKAVSQFVETLAGKQLKPPTSLTAARGRGKSAAMGLSVAAAVYFGYVNIYVTSPHPENLITFFEFILKGFDVLEYQEHTDYTIIRSTNAEYKKAIIRINISRSSRQTIQYISPNDAHMLNAADLLVIDEAAAIPLPLVKKMLGPYIIFMASTINGYEGTGRALSLKLIAALQKGNNAPPPIKLDESIRYHEGDDIEHWLMSLLCLNTNLVQTFNTGCPTPEACELYYIDRDALFSYHKAAESFLQRLVSIYTSAHYKNSPNDLQMMSDAPAHHLFCLLGPLQRKDQLPEVYVVIQVALEGQLSSQVIGDSLGRGRKANGDLIPWNISEQYSDREFPKLAGARIVRIATHPNYHRMGYGRRAMRLLIDYYRNMFKNLNENLEEETYDNGFEEVEEAELSLLNEEIRPRKKIPVLLKRLNERIPEQISYLGTCNGLTQDLLKFWKCLQFVPVYLSQKANDLTGEHSCIMLHVLNNSQSDECNWLESYFYDFKRRVLKLFGKSFRDFPIGLALSLLDNKSIKCRYEHLDKATLDVYFLAHDVQRLDLYARNQIEYRLILDLTTDISYLYFLGKIDVQLDTIQKAILLAIGIQGKSVDAIASELTITGAQVLAKFYDMIKKITKYFTDIIEGHIENSIMKSANTSRQQEFEPIKISLNDELDDDAQRLSKTQREELRKLKLENAKDFEIKGSDSDWRIALADKQSKIKLLSVKSAVKRLNDDNDVAQRKQEIRPKKIKRKQK